MVVNVRYRRLLEPPAGSFFLFGVRGVGKSTWTRAAFADAHVVDLLNEGTYHALLGDPSAFTARWRRCRAGRPWSSTKFSGCPRC